ncbi:MAG: hypothetical protein WD266_08755 [Balneolales bacterium]
MNISYLKHSIGGSILFVLITGCDAPVSIDHNNNAVNQPGAEINYARKAHTPGKAAGPATKFNMNQILAEIRKATAKYHDVDKAEADGYGEISPFVPQMGFHYMNDKLISEDFDYTRPQMLVYVNNPADEDKRRLVAVEYAIPKEYFPDADEENMSSLDDVFPGIDGEAWEPNPSDDAWTLHAWIWHPNPEGTFAASNPRVGDGD